MDNEDEARNIARFHGGEVVLNSSFTGGSQFEVYLRRVIEPIGELPDRYQTVRPGKSDPPNAGS